MCEWLRNLLVSSVGVRPALTKGFSWDERRAVACRSRVANIGPGDLAIFAGIMSCRGAGVMARRLVEAAVRYRYCMTPD